MRLALLDYFATPVSKDGEPYVDRHAHLTWYRGIQGPEPVRAVTLENTFGKLKIRTATGAGLLVPTQQIAQASPFPDRLDHYKVYRLSDVLQIPSYTVTLQDQFGSSKAQMQVPLFFGAPVDKRHRMKQFEIQNTRAHLLIVGISVRDFEEKVSVEPSRVSCAVGERGDAFPLPRLSESRLFSFEYIDDAIDTVGARTVSAHDDAARHFRWSET